MALCLSIILEAIQRFAEPQEVKNPMYVLIVGAVGLLFNILGLFMFHQHGHSHEAELEHQHSHSDALASAEDGKSGALAISHEVTSNEFSQPSGSSVPLAASPQSSPRRTRVQWRDASLDPEDRAGMPYLHRSRTGSGSLVSNTSLAKRRTGSRIEDLPAHPASMRLAFMETSRGTPPESEGEADDEDLESEYRGQGVGGCS